MKRRAILFFASFLSCLVFISCDSNRHGDTDPTLPQFSVEQKLQQQPQSDSLLPINNSPAPTDIVAYNPPHGQPGHDCAIAVGAPLNKAANAVPSPNLMTAPANPTARLNPPHGQPGHLCEIPVGQPLP